MSLDPKKVRQSRLLVSLDAKLYNSKVIQFLRRTYRESNPEKLQAYRGARFPDAKSMQKGLRDALLVRPSGLRADTPFTALCKKISFFFLIEQPWEGVEAQEIVPKLTSRNFPCLTIFFREKIKGAWGKETYYHRIYFPADDVIAKVKRGQAPNLPPLHTGAYRRTHHLLNGTRITVSCKTDSECKKWVNLLQGLSESKYKNSDIRPPVVSKDDITTRKLYPRSCRYYPDGPGKGKPAYVGYF